MACKAPGGKKKKYIYYQCNKCKTSIREDKLVERLINEINTIMEYDNVIKKHFAPLLKHKVENTNELLQKEYNSLNDKLIRLKDAYLNHIIDIEEYKSDKLDLENKINDVLTKLKEEENIKKYSFSYEDIIIRKDLESIKSFVNPFHSLTFQTEWNKLSIKEKQELITSYIDSIEVTKENDNINIEHINFRSTFIEEYANLFNKGGINKYQNIIVNGETISIEISAPMTREEIKRYIKKMQQHYAIDYQEIKKEYISDKQFMLKYNKSCSFNEPFKLIPIVDIKGLNKITHYGIIEVPVLPINIYNIDLK